ncbi:MAG: hypothetical protein ACM37W_20030 [Actinomycetota bacterium]
MNTLFFKSASVVLNIAALAMAGSALSAQADPLNSQATETAETLSLQISDSATTSLKSDEATTAINKDLDSLTALNSAVKSLPKAAEQVADSQAISSKPEVVGVSPINTAIPQKPSQSFVAPAQIQNATGTKTEKDVSSVPPLDPTTLTSASALTNELAVSPKLEPAAVTSDSEVAQVNVRPGRTTTSGPSYIGVAGNIGFSGDSRLGSSSFAIISKIGLTNNLSVRPAVFIGDNTAFTVPLTFDFQPETVDDENRINIAPYAGAGIAVSTGDRSRVGFLLSGGVDVPLSTQFTATAGLNIGFLRDTEFGLLIGVGYNFTTTPGR